MTKYAALLRGIGPNNPNMKSDKLKEFFLGLGYLNVKTVITSGNIIYETNKNDVAKMAKEIENELPIKLGFKSCAIIRSEDELKSLLKQDPFKGHERDKEHYLLITFFGQDTKVPYSLPYQPDGMPFKIIGQFEHALFGIVNLATGRTPDYMTWLEKQFGKEITSRTPKTIERIVSKMDSER